MLKMSLRCCRRAEQNRRKSALHVATERGQKEVVILLLKRGAYVECKDENDCTPVHIASDNCHAEILVLLLKCGADIEATDRLGRTAFHIACNKKYATIINVLLNFGCDIYGGFSPITYSQLEYETPDYDAAEIDGVGMSGRIINDIFHAHVIKMSVLEDFISLKEVELGNFNGRQIMLFEERCREELQTIRSKKICDNVSLYDVLTGSVDQLAMFCRNKNVMQILTPPYCKEKFPLYHIFLNSQINKGCIQNKLHRDGFETFNSLFRVFPKLPYESIEKIFSYLSHKDLKSFNACKETICCYNCVLNSTSSPGIQQSTAFC